MDVYDYHNEPGPKSPDERKDEQSKWFLLTLFILACVAGYQFAAWLA